ncbi:unnamed protein product [Staurois parvus]|uniref:Uncharacterized protein n=1 Tax=Staurois parvus TaxID=386267 RepID=A0ABN9GY81_9NEOB|nr:unnamed protein product [Staurois parvus]
MSPLQRPRPSPPADAGIRLPGSDTLRAPGHAGDRTGGKFYNFKIKHYCIKPFHIHFVPTALSCALPAFLPSFLPGN